MGHEVRSSSGLLRRVQLGLFLMVGLGWLFAVSLGLGAWLDPGAFGPAVGLFGLIGIVLVATLITRLVLHRPTRWSRIALASLGLIVALLVAASVATTVAAGRVQTSDDFWRLWNTTGFGFRVLAAGGLALAAWWRGIIAGRSLLILDDVIASSRNATAVLAVVFLLNAIVGPANRAPTLSLVGATLVVLFASLVGIPLARLRDVSAAKRNVGQAALTLNRHWLGMLLGAVLALLDGAILLALLLTFDRIDQLFSLISGPLDTVLWSLVYIIAVPVGYLLQFVIELARRFLHPGQPPSQSPALSSDWVKQLQSQAGHAVGPPAAFLVAAKVVVALIIAGIVILLLTRAAFRYADSLRDDDVAEERDFVVSLGELWAALLAWLRSLAKRPASLSPRSVLAVAPIVVDGALGRDPRALYRELLRLGARLGRPRQPSETPGEYQRGLIQVAPWRGGGPEIRALTEVYSTARYAPAFPEEERVAAAAAALERLRELAAEEAARGTVDGAGVRQPTDQTTERRSEH